MVGQLPSLRVSVGSVILIGILSGCDSTPPVAETPPPPVSVSQPVVHEVIDYDDYEGRIEAVETVEVRARVRGHLTEVSFKDGEIVKKGDLLFTIDPRPYKAALDADLAQKASAEASLDLAKKEYDRIATLARSNAASREEMDTWKAKQAVAIADRLKAMAAVEQSQLDLDFTKVVAPISGRISRTQVTVGNLVNGSGGETLLTTIVTVDPMYVYFDVDERALLLYKRKFHKDLADGGPEPSVKDLKIPIKVALEGEENYPHAGMIDFADNHVNTSTGTIQVRGVLPNPKRILDAGMRARVRVSVSDPHQVLIITERAIGTGQDRKFVYIVNDRNVVERRDITTDRLVDGMQVIKEGLKPEDWVIVNGIQRVRDGAKVEPQRVSMPGMKQPAEIAQNQTKN